MTSRSSAARRSDDRSQLPTSSENAALDRDSKLAIEAAVTRVVPRDVSIRDLRRRLRAIPEEEEISTRPRQFAYGYVRLETDVVFREVDRKGRLHLVAAVSGDEIDKIAFGRSTAPWWS